MNKELLLILILTIAIGRSQAQENEAKQRLFERFHSFNSVKVLNGSTTTSLALNSVNGFQFQHLFAGIGVGFDYYFHTTVPLFLEARYDLVKAKGKLQVVGNGGINFPFSSQNKKYQTQTGPYKPAIMYGGGLDYLIPVKQQALILGIGFSNKHVIQLVENNIWNPVLNRSENIPIRNEYSLNRIALRIGWRF